MCHEDDVCLLGFLFLGLVEATLIKRTFEVNTRRQADFSIPTVASMQSKTAAGSPHIWGAFSLSWFGFRPGIGWLRPRMATARNPMARASDAAFSASSTVGVAMMTFESGFAAI